MLQQVLGINVRFLNLFSAKQEKLRTKMSFIRKICHLHSFFITVTAFSQTETKMNVDCRKRKIGDLTNKSDIMVKRYVLH